MTTTPWRSTDRPSVDAWRSTLSEAALQTIVDAAARLPLDPQRWSDDPSAVVDPVVGEAIATLAARLWDGSGFFWLRGLPADDADLLRRLFWVIGNNLGEPVMQNARGEILSEVTDRFAGADRGPDTRGYESNDELRFHCDGPDLTCELIDRGRGIPGGQLPAGALPDLDTPRAQLPEGGYGWFLIQALTRHLNYARIGGENHLTFSM